MPVAAITGAASGIGRSLAIALGARGYACALADLDEAGARQTSTLISGTAPSFVFRADVADRNEVDAFAAATLQRFERVDLLINNAGVSIGGTVEELTVDEMAWVVNVNFWGVVHGVKAFLKPMLAQGSGTIVNVSSVFGLWAPGGQSAYAASKFAVRGFSESLRAEIAPRGLHVVTVHPAGVRTNIAKKSRFAAAADPALMARRTEAFDRRFLTIDPDVAAGAIIDGIDRKRDRVLIGSEARRIDAFVRFLGDRGSRILARAGAKRFSS